MFIVSELTVGSAEVKIVKVVYNILDAISVMNSSAGAHHDKNTAWKTYETLLTQSTRAEVWSRTKGWIGDNKLLEYVYEINEVARSAEVKKEENSESD